MPWRATSAATVLVMPIRPGLGGGVVGLAGIGARADDRGDVDDAPEARARASPHRAPGQPEGALQVGVEHAVPVLVIDLIASVVGPRANAGQANDAAAKAGLIGMTKTISHEVARRGITVNAVAPGFIETDMTKDLLADVVKAIPARRAGQPEEVAAAVRFLASDDAAYVTGTTLFVDGGMSA